MSYWEVLQILWADDPWAVIGTAVVCIETAIVIGWIAWGFHNDPNRSGMG